ncbi:MAG: diaminopimelate epimerase [Rhodospirillales bacterium]|jgi:diaminopimelate epimerase|uniref:diaminopimelate epimerase n=1 Tax=Hwanghaeella sp. 1Z406 TaxID=3402811 RepID=UPI000C91EFFE|nr:diaminopimelate epimerase [Rhodospirillales bacterium]|tara:strand:- start:78664 stop:79488 length:825 start_codon:yes stop_codon:yes gene_type:complete
MVAFKKMHGLGNDFVVLDARAEPIDLPESRIRLIGDRHFGIGFDQLMVIQPAQSQDADIFLRIYNPDGSEAEACGNGTRCVADQVMTELGKATCTIDTIRGRLLGRRQDDMVTIDMGAALLDWQDVPLASAMDTLHLNISQGPLSDPVAVGMGNPHCVFFVEDAEAIDLPTLGPILEHHRLFPRRTNVEIASLSPDGQLRLRVWERGAGITLACGSGTCATAVAAHRRGLVDAASAPVKIRVDGGEMSIQWRQEDGHVLMTGPTALSFIGEMAL